LWEIEKRGQQVSAEFHEKDELEQLKAWWRNYGSALVIGVTIGLVGLFGYRYWNEYRLEQAATASGMYDNVVDHIKSSRTEQAKQVGGEIIDKYDGTPYAGMTALLLARMYYDNGDEATARKQLSWAIDHASETAVRHAARLRLTRIMMAKQEYDAVLSLLATNDTDGYATGYQELRGDALAAKGQTAAAREAYTAAIAADPGSEYAEVLRMKLANLPAEPGKP
jgi:predicted negative regulator of RcsB-dependent stress response